MKRRHCLIALALLLSNSCSKPRAVNTTSSDTASDAKHGAEPAVTSTASATSKKVKFTTNKGSFVIELNEQKAPITVANFLQYVEQKHYDGTVFHRVIDDFMIQGGGFSIDGKVLSEKPTGKGIKNEASNGLLNQRGTVAMARTNDPNSATAQFFINVADNAMLDAPKPDGYGYAVFGKVTSGMDVVDAIKAVSTNSQTIRMRHPATGQAIDAPADNVPVEPVVIESATIEPSAP